MAVPLQVQWLCTGSYIGSERLAPAVDYGQVPGGSAYHRADYDGRALVERTGASRACILS